MKRAWLLLLAGCFSSADRDGDGFGITDCDDTDPTIYPNAAETCNGVDDDCDGVIDEEAVDALSLFEDADGDGFGSEVDVMGCGLESGLSQVSGDCDDARSDVFPGAPERCNGLDDDCNGEAEDILDCRETCGNGLDDDADGRVDCEDAECAEDPDCAEKDCSNGLDEDGDGAVDCQDADCWGLEDCGEGLARVVGGTGAVRATEITRPEGRQRTFEAIFYDVKGSAYRPEGPCGWTVETTRFLVRRASESGALTAVTESVQRNGVVTDCETVDGVFPRFLEPEGLSWSRYGGHRFETQTVTGEETDGGGLIEQTLWYFDPLGPSEPVGRCADGGAGVWFGDGDADGYGAESRLGCAEKEGWVTRGGDCIDSNPLVHPAAVEICGNGVDDDCDGRSTCDGLSGVVVEDAAWARVGGEADGDRTRLVVEVGDLDGDGKADWAIGGKDNDSAGKDAGAVYFFVGGVSGDRGAEDAEAVLRGNAGDWLGSAIAGVGDLDGDGFDDVVVGATGVDADGATRAGAAFFLYGPFEGEITLGEQPAVRGASTLFLGAGVAAGGDVDGDGRRDVWVGATADDRGGSIAGSVSLVPGPLDTDVDLFDLATVVVGDGPDARIGEVFRSGDVDGDSRPDLVIGDRWSEAGASGGGAVHLFSGPSGFQTTADALATWEGGAVDARAGSVVAVADLDLDGYAEIIASAPRSEGVQPNVEAPRGTVFVLEGGPGLVGGQLETEASATLLGARIWDEAGTCLAVGDLDGNGVPEVLVGAPGDDAEGLYSGVVYRVEAPDGVLELREADHRVVGHRSLWLTGSSCAVLGDVDGDGTDDLGVGSRAYGSGADRGSVSVLLGGSGW